MRPSQPLGPNSHGTDKALIRPLDSNGSLDMLGSLLASGLGIAVHKTLICVRVGIDGAVILIFIQRNDLSALPPRLLCGFIHVHTEPRAKLLNFAEELGLAREEGERELQVQQAQPLG
ncbi:hypothetical protein HYQ46_001140 [Verticillium longisporum]|nr:hypothetical protein HYQ46_001140 [Verticillium longisporum]